MSRLLMIVFTNLLITLFVHFSPVSAPGSDRITEMVSKFREKMMTSLDSNKFKDNIKTRLGTFHRFSPWPSHQDRQPKEYPGALVDLANKFSANVMPSLESLGHGGGSMETLREMVNKLRDPFEQIRRLSLMPRQPEVDNSVADKLQEHIGNIKAAVYEDLNVLTEKWYGPTNPHYDSFVHEVQRGDHAQLTARLMEHFRQLKNDLMSFQNPAHSHKKDMQGFQSFAAYRRLPQLHAYICLCIFKQMQGNMTVQQEVDLPWSLSQLAVNLWAYAALGVPGAEEAAEKAQEIMFQGKKGSGLEEAETSASVKSGEEGGTSSGK